MAITAKDLLSLDCDKVGIALILDALENDNHRTINDVLAKHVPGHYGWESISDGRVWRNGYWCDCIAEYLNMGDTYDTTILYDVEEGDWMVTSWGDWYEGWESEQEEDSEECADDDE